VVGDAYIVWSIINMMARIALMWALPRREYRSTVVGTGVRLNAHRFTRDVRRFVDDRAHDVGVITNQASHDGNGGSFFSQRFYGGTART